MIIVRTPAGEEVAGWRLKFTSSGSRDDRPVLLHPDGTACGAAHFGLHGLRATATTAAERSALERGGYLPRPRRSTARGA